MKNSTKLGLITGFTVGIAALAYYDSCIKKEVIKTANTTTTVVKFDKTGTITLFVSVPMRDKTEEQIRKDFENAKTKVETMYPNAEIKLIDTFIKDNKTAIECLGASIAMMEKADLVYFCKNWENARGCCVEHDVAVKYGKKCIYE